MMKTSLKQLTVLLLAVVLCFSFVGCKGGCGNGGGNDSSVGNEPPVVEIPEPKPNPGHEVIESTDGFIVKNGVSGYKIVVPDAVASEENLAAGELRTLLDEATGISLETVVDTDAAQDGKGKYIFIGDTVQADTNGIKPDKAKYGVSGYEIKTEGEAVYIRGAAALPPLFCGFTFPKYIIR